MTRVSVCVATYNGERYIKEQLLSILKQLRADDEVIVTDDGSRDGTVAICRELRSDFPEVEVSILNGPKRGLVKNFENALRNAKGEYIFLSDQDDVWADGKIEKVLRGLRSSDLVITDCKVVDSNLKVLDDSFFRSRSSGPGFVKNYLKNSYLGCCMAFRREVRDLVLPFPEKVGMHDWWIGLTAEAFCKRVVFLECPLVLYRRHGENASCTAEKSSASFFQKIRWRADIARFMLLRRFFRR